MPRADGAAPSDLLFGFRQRTPDGPPRLSFSYVEREEREKALKARKTLTFDASGGKLLSPLMEGSQAFMQDGNGQWTELVTIGPTRPSGRSYVVIRDGGEETVRNRRFLRPAA